MTSQKLVIIALLHRRLLALMDSWQSPDSLSHFVTQRIGADPNGEVSYSSNAGWEDEELKQKLVCHRLDGAETGSSAAWKHGCRYRIWRRVWALPPECIFFALSRRASPKPSPSPCGRKQLPMRPITAPSPQTAPACPQKTHPHRHQACRDCGCLPACGGCRARCPDGWPCVAPDP